MLASTSYPPLNKKSNSSFTDAKHKTPKEKPLMQLLMKQAKPRVPKGVKQKPTVQRKAKPVNKKKKKKVQEEHARAITSKEKEA